MGDDGSGYWEYTCDDYGNCWEEYYYFDSYNKDNNSYNTGDGMLTFLGDYFGNMDMKDPANLLIVALAYIWLAFGGLILFPPMAICLYLSDGNLDLCSVGVWSNDYKAHEQYSSEGNHGGYYYEEPYEEYHCDYCPVPVDGEEPIYSWNYDCN